jgi:hypothetical protein
MQHGTRKRGRYDFLATSDKPRWLVVQDRCSRVIDITYLPPGTNLRAALDNAVAQRKSDGWNVEGHDGRWRWSGFFCHRDGERVSVLLMAVGPEADRS